MATFFILSICIESFAILILEIVLVCFLWVVFLAGFGWFVFVDYFAALEVVELM